MHRILGIDIGKDHIHVGIADPTAAPKRWQVVKIDLASPDWYVALTNLIDPDHEVYIVAEPTGWHYLAPVARVLHHFPNVNLYLANHHVTGHTRAIHISDDKTDKTDAQALALIASQVAAGAPPRGVRRYDPERERLAQQLRLTVNAHFRLKKTSTKLKNQLNALAHAMFPVLAQRSDTWFNAIRLGAVTPAQIKRLVAAPPTKIDYRMFRHVERLAADLPDFDLEPPAGHEATIRDLHTQLVEVEQQIVVAESTLSLLLQHPAFKDVAERWMSMPGAGLLSVAACLSACRGLPQDLTPDEFTKAVGCAPQTSASGQRDIRKIRKTGYRKATAVLHLWTMQLLSPSAPANPVRDFHEAAVARGKPRPIYATRAKLASILSGVARSESGYQYEEKQQ